jgi:RNA polymerase sigma factor (sigma-70 family)
MAIGRLGPPDRNEPDVTLLKPAKPHADRELARILSEHARALERVAASFTRTRADRDDLLQDFALALWKAFPSFRRECSERSFVLRVAHNRALDFLARRRPVAEPLDDHEGSVVATTGKNPVLAYERKERGSQLLAVVRALPLGHRQVVTLLLEGLSQREIAEVLGTTENAVNVRVGRARSAMRALLENERSEETER